MKIKEESVQYLTRAEVEASRQAKARARMELVRRVERGEITAAEANCEASIFQPEVFNPAEARTANFDEVVDNLLKLKARRTNDRRKPKAIRS